MEETRRADLSQMLPSKTLLLALPFVLPGAAAYGHIRAWIIDGVSKAGFNPSNPGQLGPTAQRPVDNVNQGMSR